ncbi:hypothetical protein HA052_19665 [Chromobacterium haemolyticum]|uniref:Uncharacterized protein n=1 Tax=Chromobacterium fluminis TaxID=3044269 RepID=A0ABX0LJN7_9NEIS|nr:hypothetical protein [Chromobacterium haemolyticum]NHR07412.1 hypothetical protein [Chromobacterium haemolyticum]
MDLQKGMKLIYQGFETTPSVEIKAVMLDDHQEYDGGLQGVAVRWLKKPGKPSEFIPCKSGAEFARDERFANLLPPQPCHPENKLMMADKLPFVDLTQQQQEQAVARYINARSGDGYLYELDYSGNVLCRQLCWSAYSPAQA